jgi:putative ABC transport system permease protein
VGDAGPMSTDRGARWRRRGCRDPLWTRAWTVLPHRLVEVAAVAAAVAVAVLVAAAAPLFVASIGNDVLEQQLSSTTADEAAISMTLRRALGPPVRHTRFVEAVEAQLGAPWLGPRRLSMNGTSEGASALLFRADPVDVEAQRARIATSTGSEWLEGSRPSVRLVSDPDALAAMEVVWETGQPGVWVVDLVADQLGIGPGDAIVYTASRSGEGVERAAGAAPVAGVYRDPWASGALDAAWARLPRDVAPPAPPRRGDLARWPTLLLAEPTVLQQLSSDAADPVTLRLRWPIVDLGMTVPEARERQRHLTRLEEALADARTEAREASVRLAGPDRLPTLGSPLPSALAGAQLGQQAVIGQIRSTAIAGVALALGVVAAAGAFVLERQRVHCRAAWLQGISPAAFAVRQAWELLPSLALGGLLGWGAGLLVVRTQGPWSALEPVWVATSIRWAAIAALAGLAVLTAVMIAHAHRVVTPGHRAGVLRVSLFVGLAATCVAALVALPDEATEEVGVLSQALPLLLAVTAAVGAAALLDLVLTPRRDRPRSPLLELSLARLQAGLHGGTALVVAVAVATSAILYAGSLADAAEVGTHDKAIALVGARSVATLHASVSELPELDPSLVTVLQASVQVAPGDATATLLVLDTGRADGAGLWGDRLASRSSAASRQLRAARSELTPVLAAGQDARHVGDGVTLRSPRFTVDAEVTARPEVWPGMGATRPVYVAELAAFDGDTRELQGLDLDPAQLDPLLDRFFVQVWSDLEPDELLAELTANDVSVRSIRSLGQELARPQLTAQLATVGFLRLLGAVAASVAFAAVCLYLSSRQRERVLSYAVSRRMGLSGRQHWWALVGELGGLVVLALVVAVPVTWVGSDLVTPLLDPLPFVPPPTTGVVPRTLVAATILGAIAAALVTAVAVQVATARADVAEVLRVAE